MPDAAALEHGSGNLEGSPLDGEADAPAEELVSGSAAPLMQHQRPQDSDDALGARFRVNIRAPWEEQGNENSVLPSQGDRRISVKLVRNAEGNFAVRIHPNEAGSNLEARVAGTEKLEERIAEARRALDVQDLDERERILHKELEEVIPEGPTSPDGVPEAAVGEPTATG